jgi:hypothetical protein
MPVKFRDVQQRFLDVGLLVRNHVMLITSEEEVKRQGEKSRGETIDNRYGVWIEGLGLWW